MSESYYTAALAFTLESDGEDVYGDPMPDVWAYPTVTVTPAAIGTGAGVELIDDTERTATITITAVKADLDFIFVRGVYAESKCEYYRDLLDVDLRVGAVPEPTPDGLLRRMRETLEESQLMRATVDAQWAEWVKDLLG